MCMDRAQRQHEHEANKRSPRLFLYTRAIWLTGTCSLWSTLMYRKNSVMYSNQCSGGEVL
jgi:hypothetical protein